MTVTITIECDNAAFEHPGPELERILKRLADHVGTTGIWQTDDLVVLDGYTPRDINGNHVGSVKVSE